MSFSARNPVTPQGAIAGIVAGVATVGIGTARGVTLADMFSGLLATVKDIDVGALALGSAWSPPPSSAPPPVPARLARRPV